MKKITPVMLVLLLVASLMANIDVTNLETTEEIEETGARNGPDAEVVAITSPKESVCNPTCSNTIFVGQATTFEAYIQNSGDQDLTEMGYRVSIYLSDQQGSPDMLAKDQNGTELVWENNNVVCDFNCEFTSIAAGDVYKNGKTTLQFEGNDITWTPIAGEYIIYIEIISEQDVNRENDDQMIFVKVEDYIDIEVEIEWKDDGSQDWNPDFAKGADPKEFMVTVTMGGSTDFLTYNLSVLIEVGGNLLSAEGEDGTDLVAESSNNDGYTLMIGDEQNVVVRENVSDFTDNETGDRYIFSNNINGGEWTYNGTVTPNAQGNQKADYFVDVSLNAFNLMDVYPDCAETYIVNVTDEDGNVEQEDQTFDWVCEEEQKRDDFTRNNVDEITGSTETFHDIRASSLIVLQGFGEGGEGQPNSAVTADSVGGLEVGPSWVQVVVEHRGSEPSVTYDWNVTFEITNLDTGVTQTNNSVMGCDSSDPPSPYFPLGYSADAIPDNLACVYFDFGVGEYEIVATLALNSTKNDDMKLSNNVVTMTKKSINNLPIISSLDLVTQGDLYLGMPGFVDLEASVFDADDQLGENLEYRWYVGDASSTPLNCGTGFEEEGSEITPNMCRFEITEEYVMILPVILTVTDEYEGSSTERIDLEIWNSFRASSTSVSDIRVEYDITYWSPSDFEMTITDLDTSSCEGISLKNNGVDLRGTYTPVALLDFSAAQYDSSSVLMQTLSIKFPNSLEAKSLWYSSACGNEELTQLLSEQVDVWDEDSSYSIISTVLNGASLRSGQLLLIADELVEEQPPVASISGFSATPGKGGAINMNWGLTNTPLDGDKISISITHEDGTEFAVDLDTATDSYTYSGSSTTHGESYDVEVAVCNTEGLCSTPIGSATVVADKEVEGATATSVQVAEADDKWTLSWSTTSDDLDDVAYWNVCYQNRESFDAANMPTTCVSTESSDVMTADVMMSTAPGQYTVYFVVVPVDALENSGTAGSSSDAGADAAFYKANEGGEITNDNSDSDDKDSGELPGWTWGAIGGVVVVAFIAGAFILSRGGGDGEDKDWDY